MAPVTTEEATFSNPLAPAGEMTVKESKPQRLTNADFRKLLMTPRAPTATSGKDGASVPSTTQSGRGTDSTVEDTPSTMPKTPSSKDEGPGASERKKKKSYYARMKKEEEEKMAELAEKYRDRARERRDGKNPDYQPEDPAQPGMGAYRAVAPDIKSGLDAAERRKQMIQESKFLGGDMEHTHLVKGLDYALLQKVRSEITFKEQEGLSSEGAAAAASVAAPQAEQSQQEEQPPEKKALQLQPPQPQLIMQQSGAAEEELAFKTSSGRRIYHAVFPPSVNELNEAFLPGRLAYAIDLEEEADTDIPITVLRSKADLVDIENMQATFTSNDIVIQKLTQILSYLRTGRAAKKQKKKDKAVKEATTAKATAEDSIYGEIGDYAPPVASRGREERGRDAPRKGERRGDERGEREGGSSRHKSSRSGGSYFNRAPQDEVREQRQEAERRVAAEAAKTGAEGAAALATNANKAGLAKSGSQVESSYYTECYPGMAEMQDAIDDSDDEADYTKMDLGNKKGPIGRWDFDTPEEYSNYMNQREALPKAAFQYGVKMADGRKTRRIVGGAGREKDKHAELNREWQQIQRILKRRKDDGSGGNKRGRFDY